MPLTTRFYNLTAFIEGDSYASLADKRRFSTVDNQIYRVAELIGDGVINGWDISELDFPSVNISDGNGLINGYFANTFNNELLNVPLNSTSYIFAQRKNDIIGIQGPKSDVVSVRYLDSGPPAQPDTFSATAIDSFTINLSWSESTDLDFDHYEIERLENDVIVKNIILEQQTNYTDSVDEYTDFTYNLYAVDHSNNRSAAKTTTVSTSLGNFLPPNPISIRTAASFESATIAWNHSPAIKFENIDHYLLRIVALNSDNSEESSSIQTETINKNLLYEQITGLTNGQRYKITIYTVDNHSRVSSGYSTNITPLSTIAPSDPESIVYSMVQSSGGVQVNLSWDSGDSPYNPTVTYRYRIYIQIEDNLESHAIDVPIGFTSEQISLYSYNLVEYFSIPENSLTTIRITALDSGGHESPGTLLRFKTAIFTPTFPLQNPNAEFDVDNRTIRITWKNPTDTDHIILVALKDDLTDEYLSEFEIINSNIGKVQYYTINDIELNKKYTIQLTPYNQNNISGNTTELIIQTNIPSNVPLPEVPVFLDGTPGDREITLNWQRVLSNSAKFYNIYRLNGSISFNFSNWSKIDTIPASSTSFTDYGLTNGDIYTYYLTAVDVYGRETLHLSDKFYNLNYIEVIPQSSSYLSEATSVSAVLTDTNVVLTWDSLLDEFDSFGIYRSQNNLHSWQLIATVDRDVFTYTDAEFPLIDGSIFYYAVSKFVNDADIILRNDGTIPDNSIELYKVVSSGTALTITDLRREIKNLTDPIAEYTNTYLLPHRHRELLPKDPTRIDLNPILVVTDWTTTDGKIFSTSEIDISGTSYILKVNGSFPSTFYRIDVDNRLIIFSEPIAEIDPITGEVSDPIPTLELRITGIEETQNILSNTRFGDLHARQIAFGTVNLEQLPVLNHEGRIKEKLLPKSFLLEKYSNNIYVVPQRNTDSNKSFGNGTVFYSTCASDGTITDILNFDSYSDGTEIAFRSPEYSATTSTNINSGSISAVTSNPSGFQTEKCYHFQFQFVDNSSSRWVRIQTTDTAIAPNPVIDLSKRLRFKLLNLNSSIYLTLGIREITDPNAIEGSNGGTNGPIEWVGVDSVTDNVPKGIKIEASNDWQDIDLDLQKLSVTSYENGNGILSKGKGVLEHIAFTINSEDENCTDIINIYIDQIQQVNDVLVSGTSQGIQVSEDFGTTWNLTRLTDTPVHKFYKGINNQYLWAISATQVFIATDPKYWFVCQGTTGVQFIRDITEDSSGNMYISTTHGVYWLDISLITHFGRFVQTQPINAYSSDCYGLYHNSVSSGVDEIWVSTESGVYKTSDQGDTWSYLASTAGFVCYQFSNIGDNNIIGINKKQILRKYNSVNFEVVADLEEQVNSKSIWKFAYFNEKLLVSTDNGVFRSESDLFESGVIDISFARVFSDLSNNNFVDVVFGMDVINIGTLGNRLFLGLENSVKTIDVDNKISTKKQYQNKEYPSFFINNTEINIGYIYNAFNNVLCFREPQSTQDVIYCSYLPRHIFIAENAGWAQTNASADVFIYRNNIPTWTDFKLDENLILGELSTLKSSLNNIPNLTDFNSLYPQSTTYLNTLLSDISDIQTENNGSSKINSETLRKFILDYTLFLNSVNNTVKSEIIDPKIVLSGFSKSERLPNSKAYILSQSIGDITDSSVGLAIDTYTGEFDSTSAFASATSPQEKNRFKFSKYDDMRITVFNSTIANTGEFTHTEVEDKMELINSGLSSGLEKVAITNLIKTGIYAETRNPLMFDRFGTTNRQAKYYSALTNDWYDIINSTIDYSSLVSSDAESITSRFVTCILLVDNDPYLENAIWFGTDNSLLQYTLDNQDLLFDSIIELPINGFVNDLFKNNDDIYIVITDDSKSYIYLTQDYGTSWDTIETTDLPKFIYSFRMQNGNMIVSTNEGIFYSDNNFKVWYKSELANTSDSDLKSNFQKPTTNILSSNFVIFEANKSFYISNHGIEFFGSGTLSSVDAVNKIERYKNITYIATNNGLFNDGGSILSTNMEFSQETKLEDTTIESESLSINDITYGSDALYCCANNKIYRFYSDPDNNLGNVWTSYEVDNFGTVQKMKFFSTSSFDYLILSSYEKIKLINVTHSSGVFN